MNGLILAAACVCAASAQVLPYHGLPAAAPSHQFHAQDEFGQFSFGHAGGPSARTEARNAYGVTTGSYQYVDANGLLQTVNYIADPVNGFRVAGTNLPVGPTALPVNTLVGPAAVEDTAEVAAAKAEFFAAFEAASAAAAEEPAERRKRDADEAVVAAPSVLPFAYGLGHHGLVAAAPATIVSDIAHAVPTYAAAPAVAYAAAPAVAYPHAVAPAVAYAHAPAVAAPLAAAAPSREAVLTTVKLNPGHAVFYRVD